MINIISGTFWLLGAGIAPTNALKSALKYLQYTNIFTRAFSTIKWWIIQAVYGIANATSELLNQMMGLSSFVDQLHGKGEIGNLMSIAQRITPFLMTLCLIWIGIKIIIDHEAPKIKNVIVQLFISAFLITNIGTISSWLTARSVSIGQSLIGVNTKEVDKGTSALPFNVIKSHTNDLEYMIDTNFKGTAVSSARSQDQAPAKLKWGLNDLTRAEVDNGEVDFTEVLDNAKIKDNSPLEKKDHQYKKGDYDKKPGTHFLYGWLKYTADSTPKENGKGSKWHTSDIWHLLDFSIGGYQRYTVKFIPVLICLVALAFAYIFAGYAIVKSFIDIVVMNILATIIFSTDLDTGQKTKRALNSIFSAILLVSLQAFELSFYQAACTWANISINSIWGFTIFMVAATIMLITGNDKVSQFFNVDTGAQRGWRAAGSVMYGARQIGRMGMAAATAPIRAKGMADNLSRKMNTPRSIRKDAEKQASDGARQHAINLMAGYDSSGNKIEPQDDGLPPLSQTPQAAAKAGKVQSSALKAASAANSAAGSTDRQNSGFDSVKRGQTPGNSASAAASNPGKETQANDTNTANATSPDNFSAWQQKAQKYDKVNRLKPNEDSSYNPVDYNPATKQPYTYDEWKNNVNNVRTNDVPEQNLDGTEFIPDDNSQNLSSVSSYAAKRAMEPAAAPKADDLSEIDSLESQLPPDEFNDKPTRSKH